MPTLITAVKKFVKSEDAPTMVEYGLLVALIAIVAAVGATTLGGNAKTLYTTIAPISTITRLRSNANAHHRRQEVRQERRRPDHGRVRAPRRVDRHRRGR